MIFCFCVFGRGGRGFDRVQLGLKAMQSSQLGWVMEGLVCDSTFGSIKVIGRGRWIGVGWQGVLAFCGLVCACRVPLQCPVACISVVERQIPEISVGVWGLTLFLTNACC